MDVIVTDNGTVEAIETDANDTTVALDSVENTIVSDSGCSTVVTDTGGATTLVDESSITTVVALATGPQGAPGTGTGTGGYPKYQLTDEDISVEAFSQYVIHGKVSLILSGTSEILLNEGAEVIL